MSDATDNTLAGLIARLNELAGHIGGDALVRVNGEYLSTYSLTFRNPIARFGDGYGMSQVAADPARSQVVDFDANGRKSDDLPVHDYPFVRLS